MNLKAQICAEPDRYLAPGGHPGRDAAEAAGGQRQHRGLFPGAQGQHRQVQEEAGAQEVRTPHLCTHT